VRIIAKKALRDFWLKHADAEDQLKSWYNETENSTWKSFNDLKAEFPSASILNDNRVVFNIKGNNYRLIVKFNLDYQICWIRFVGTHAEYDKINANEV
jgi:mRNA interferase HigB